MMQVGHMHPRPWTATAFAAEVTVLLTTKVAEGANAAPKNKEKVARIGEKIGGHEIQQSIQTTRDPAKVCIAEYRPLFCSMPPRSETNSCDDVFSFHWNVTCDGSTIGLDSQA
jgi:hypothetical protein